MNHLNKLYIIGMLAVLLAVPAPLSLAGAPADASNIRLTTMQGKTLRLADLRGKWVLVNFWAPWCPLCYHEVPALKELDARKDVVVIGMAVEYGQDEASVGQAIERIGMNYQAHVLGGNRSDPDSQARQIGAAMFYPTTFVYAPDGRQVEVIAGLVQPDRILALIDAQAKQRPAIEQSARIGKRKS